LPYLSIVLTARNDDYGGDFNSRLQNFLSRLSFLLEKYQVPSELIIVNYNPIPDKPGLKEVIEFPENTEYLTIRIITVPPEVHQSLYAPEIRKTVPLYEFIAKNAGIRRAQGEYILSTNADIIFDEKIIRYIAERRLTPGYYYRADRCDYIGFEQTNKDTDYNEYINRLKKHTFIVSLKGNKYKFAQPALGFDLQLWKARIFNRFKLEFDLFGARHAQLFNKLNLYINNDNAEFIYHTNNCGDFMLMHRNHWFELKGYPENTYISTHTDALFVVTAGVSGIKEKVFNSPIFHQEHERRYGWQAIENDEMFQKVYRNFENHAQEMIRTGKPIIFNKEDWGLRQLTIVN